MASAFRRKDDGTSYAMPYGMAHPYPPHWASFDYIGRHRYALTFITDGRRVVFTRAEPVDQALTQILRACTEKAFAVIAYCFMPDHLHLIVEGDRDDSDGKALVKAAKQYSAYHFKQANGYRLWERYGHDRVIRDDMELAMTVRYLVANPVRAGLVKHPGQYPFLGSGRYTVVELLEWCEYPDAVL